MPVAKFLYQAIFLDYDILLCVYIVIKSMLLDIHSWILIPQDNYQTTSP
jgi:hypothetical protein